MAIKMLQDFCRWKQGEIITPNGSLADRLVGQGLAVPVEAPPPLPIAPEEQPEAKVEADDKAGAAPARGRGKTRKDIMPEGAQEA